MNILVTGARGFIGRNLMETLSYERPQDTVFGADVDTSREEWLNAVHSADFVFHLAGINRPQDPAEFMTGNRDLTVDLLEELKKGKCPPVLLSGSAQAALDNPYGQSKLAAERAVLQYGEETGAPVYAYRLNNAFGKWSRPNYNSAVATFCYNIARGLPIQVNNPDAPLYLCYVDDIIAEWLNALEGNPTWDGDLCKARPVYALTVGQLADTLKEFHKMRDELACPDQSNSLICKLYATYLSFLPPEDLMRPTVVHADHRGSFTELLHLAGHGQVSVNISKPHITKGEHWHHTKHEKFIVVSGEGVIRFRKAGEKEVISYPVSGNQPQVVDIPPGYTHNIENTGDQDMITIMWANECFDPTRPDTCRLPVDPEKEV